jgi:nucleoside-diphosphate-sugar epimerase
MERVLVTGANGFVGQTVCPALASAGLTVRAAVRDPDRLPARPPSGEVAGVGYIGPDTEWAPALAGVDAVVHLAGRVHVLKETFEDPQAEFHKINVLGTERLAWEAAGAGVRRLVYVSTVGVNGRSTSRTRPFTEEDQPVPHNPYALSKWEAERVLRRVSTETGLEVAILRPPLVYGPGVKANFLSLMRLADRGFPLPLGAVENRRSLVYVGNLADAVLACLRHPRAAGEVFLVSDGEDVSTAELLNKIGVSLNRPVRLLPVPPGLLLAAGRVTGASSKVEPLLDSLAVNGGKIRRRLGWQPPYSMDEGLEHTARWYRTTKDGG